MKAKFSSCVKWTRTAFLKSVKCTSYPNWLPLIILALASIGVMFVYDDYWQPTDDSAQYIGLAKSISEGRGFVEGFSGEPHRLAPFVFPLLLSPIISQFGYNFGIMKLLIILSLVISALLVYLLMKKSYNEIAISSAVAALFLFSAITLLYSTFILSEFPFCAFALASLWAASQLCSCKTGCKKGWWFVVLTALATAAACFTRTIGIALLPAIAACLIENGFQTGNIRSRLKQLVLIMVPTLILGSLWLLRNLYFGPPDPISSLHAVSPYAFAGISRWMSQGNLVVEAVTVAKLYFSSLIPLALMGLDTIPVWVGRLISLVTTAGFVYYFFRRRSIIEYYVFFYLLFLVAYHGWDVRYFIPVLPFMFRYLISASQLSVEFLWHTVDRISKSRMSLVPPTVRKTDNAAGQAYEKTYFRRFGMIAALLVFCTLLISNVYADIKFIETQRRLHVRSEDIYVEYANMHQAILWLDNNAKPGEKIASNAMEYLYLLGGWEGYDIPWEIPLDQLLVYIKEKQPAYIVLFPGRLGWSPQAGAGCALIEKYPEAFKLVYNCCSRKTVVIYQMAGN